VTQKRVSELERIAPVTRAIMSSLKACLDDGWEECDDIAAFIAHQLNPRADPDDPFEWTIRLFTIDGSDPDGEWDDE